ncbi:hypothetical protein JRQ81_012366 [Phrynocephalus forsythii]|uniref:Fibronectin type-III domain-containing protein n=1 Tax=Phrynocephalus forsythii TaxID=171643 RepID=A0A9Q0X5R6_9SAUR|nr:hypothetical protein JRQ81_012366 [Phrynocephalus forsythii]
MSLLIPPVSPGPSQTGSFDSFLIQYRDTEGKTQALPLEGSARRTTILGLSPSRRYKFNLIGLVGRKRIGPISAEAVTAPRVKKEEPAKPSLGEFSVSDVTSNSALLSWTVATGQFDSFLIQYKDAQGKLQALPVEGTSREVTVSDLTPARRYKFNLFGLSGRKRLGPISSEATTVKPEEEEQKQEEQEEEEEEEEKKKMGGTNLNWGNSWSQKPTATPSACLGVSQMGALTPSFSSTRMERTMSTHCPWTVSHVRSRSFIWSPPKDIGLNSMASPRGNALAPSPPTPSQPPQHQSNKGK